MAEAVSIVEHSVSNRAAFQEQGGTESRDRDASRPAIDREELAEAIVKLVNEDRRVARAILDLVMTCPNVVVQY